MSTDSIIRYNTLLLVLAAGCCDSITFVSANELFSAHVTGNFILFAYDIINGVDFVTWIRLLTFPVFLTGVVTGGWLARSTDNRHVIPKIEGGLLIIGGLLSLIMFLMHFRSVNVNFEIALLVVFAMGMQNAFGKLFSKEVYGPTTVMTGNVTQVALRLVEYFSPGKRNPALTEGLRRDVIVILGFLCGCLVGSIAGLHFGLAGILIPGCLLLFARKVY
ncbi:MAG TPA: YoaK family protein [Puia sp.]|jgi:uncharacterized membrane protein YoaK (UPF0700 family)|nr:YoaK family protein [Puia sp.]